MQVFRLKFAQKWISVWNFRKTTENKNQHHQDLGLKFEKTNIEIRINIFEILCVYVHVCQFSDKINSSDFFSSNFLKNGFTVDNSETYSQNNN